MKQVFNRFFRLPVLAGLEYGRDGSFACHVNELGVANDLKGIGPFILAGIEVQPLAGPPTGENPKIREA